MTERRGGLGRGLAALIPSGPPVEGGAANNPARGPVAETPTSATESTVRGGAATEQQADAVSRETAERDPGAVYREIPLASITPNPRQPRQVFDEDALGELEHSIREFGLMQPIVVREVKDGQFELIMGERRWRASQNAGVEIIPAIVRKTQDDALLRDALLENIHRVQLNPLEEAHAYQQLLEEFSVTQNELADRIGRSRPQITNTIRLLRLPVERSEERRVGNR